MAGAGAGGEPGSAGSQALGAAGGGDPRAGPDWANLPADLLGKVVGKVISHEAAWAAQLRRWGYSEEQSPAYWTEERIQQRMAERCGDANCLFMFARVCRAWRKAQLKVGGPLRTRVRSDVILPGSVALAKWALAEGCPRESGGYVTMAYVAVRHGHLELVKWLCGEGGFAMDKVVMGTGLSAVMAGARFSGNQELVDWLQANGSDLFSSSEELSAPH